MPGGSRSVKDFDLRRLTFLTANPDLLEQVIEANLVVGRNVAAAIGGVDEGTGQRGARGGDGRVELEVAMREFDAAIGLPCNVWVMRDHQDCVAGIVQLAKDLQDDGFVDLVEIAR